MLNIMLKMKYSFISALVFFIVANPELYKATEQVFGGLFAVITPGGVVTPAGLILHTFVFFLTMLGLMLIPRL